MKPPHPQKNKKWKYHKSFKHTKVDLEDVYEFLFCVRLYILLNGLNPKYFKFICLNVILMDTYF